MDTCIIKVFLLSFFLIETLDFWLLQSLFSLEDAFQDVQEGEDQLDFPIYFVFFQLLQIQLSKSNIQRRVFSKNNLIMGKQQMLFPMMRQTQLRSTTRVNFLINLALTELRQSLSTKQIRIKIMKNFDAKEFLVQFVLNNKNSLKGNMTQLSSHLLFRRKCWLELNYIVFRLNAVKQMLECLKKLIIKLNQPQINKYFEVYTLIISYLYDLNHSIDRYIIFMIFYTKSMFRFFLFSIIILASFSQVTSQTLEYSKPISSNIQSDLTIKSDEKICDGNRFQYISSFVLGRQSDLTQTFAEIEKTVQVHNVSYSDKIGRLYKIYNFKPKILYLESKQVAQVRGVNILNITGGTVRITYDFEWEKEQLGSSIKGNGSGLVSSDSVSFQKTLQTNETHDLQWVLSKALPITISNSLTLSKVSPYKQADYEIINQMLNKLKNNQTTAKSQLIHSLNANFSNILKQVVKNDQTIKIPKQIQYSYIDYRGEFTVLYDNILLENALSKNGLSLLLSQTINGDKSFQCGEKVPDQPEDQSKYGGTQQFISNKFFKSTLKYALEQHFIDVTLTQQNWQSRAFQFFMGDLHDVMLSTKPLSSFKQLEGKCSAMNDKSFNLNTKSISTYNVTVNFTCTLLENQTKILDMVLPVEYEIKPTLTAKQLNFVITDIKGTAKFNETSKFKITNLDLASFMLTESLNIAKNSKVIGSGYKVRNRRDPKLEVREGFLFLYDKSSIKLNLDKVPQTKIQ